MLIYTQTPSGSRGTEMTIQSNRHPIIYVRGFAMRDADIEETVNTPYMGFNASSSCIRQPQRRCQCCHGSQPAY